MPYRKEKSMSLAPGWVLLARRERQLLTQTRVFLPAAGNRNGTSVNNVGSNGYYWSASYNNSNNAYNVNFNDSNLNTDNNNNRYNGQSVRLVRVSENCFCFLIQVSQVLAHPYGMHEADICVCYRTSIPPGFIGSKLVVHPVGMRVR